MSLSLLGRILGVRDPPCQALPEHHLRRALDLEPLLDGQATGHASLLFQIFQYLCSVLLQLVAAAIYEPTNGHDAFLTARITERAPEVSAGVE